MSEFWFTCPSCGVMGSIDEDQAEGRVSIQCVTKGCDFHKTGTVRPLILTTEPTKPAHAPSFFVDENWAENIIRQKIGGRIISTAQVRLQMVNFTAKAQQA